MKDCHRNGPCKRMLKIGVAVSIGLLPVGAFAQRHAVAQKPAVQQPFTQSPSAQPPSAQSSFTQSPSAQPASAQPPPVQPPSAQPPLTRGQPTQQPPDPPPSATPAPWIRPDNAGSPPIWGIHNGIVVALWPAAIENARPGNDGGPRGLLRIGYEWQHIIYHINYIAIEPVVNGDMEFSEISPSRVDGQWGKLMWTGETPQPGRFSASAGTRGVVVADTMSVVEPDQQHPEKTILYLYVFMEKFLNGAHPYLRLSIHSDRPEELGIEVFQQPGSATMERCGVTATMGNYARLRNLYLKDIVVNAKTLYAGYQDIGFIEKVVYPERELLHNNSGDFIVMAQPDETLNELTAWPETPAYATKWSWRYRPFYKLTQYWRVAAPHADTSLQVRVNGRAKYWSGDNRNPAAYIDIPGGPAFENFELRERYRPGQQIYFGLTRKTIPQLLAE